MENTAGRRMRKRITAPRNIQEAHQLITKIKQEFGLVDAEDSYDAAMSAQQAMYAETLHQYVKCAAWAAMQAAGIKLVTLESLRDRALRVIGTPAPLPFGDKVVGVVMNRNGEVMDVIKNIKD